MEQLDRQLEKEILETLKFYFPNPKKFSDLCESMGNIHHSVLFAEISYLIGHGLAEMKEQRSGNYFMITSKGIDFLQDDGGLSAILNTVTIKFDIENVRKLFEEGIIRNIKDENEKSTLLHKLRSLPANALQKALDKLIERGIENPESLFKILESVF